MRSARTNHHEAGGRRPRHLRRVAVPLLALLLLAAACDDDDIDDVDSATEVSEESATDETETVEEVDEAELQEQLEESTAGGLALPEGFPDAFPLPDEYMIVRMNVGTYDPVGLSIAANIAIDGDVDEMAEFYDEALRSEFDDVQVLEEIQDTPWRFSGHGFELGSLYVSSNFGMTDPQGNDSSHLPVMLTIVFEEYLED